MKAKREEIMVVIWTTPAYMLISGGGSEKQEAYHNF